MALDTTLNSLSIWSLGIEQYGFVNESDGGDVLLSRKQTLKKNECCDNEANCCFLYPYETDNEASSFISSYYPYETDHEVYNFFLHPYETDYEADNFLSSYYPRETREALDLESYGFNSTRDSLMRTLSVRSLGLEEYGFIDVDGR